MKSKDKAKDGPQFLSGWKEIAQYLGKGVRTVQRYERELGLPVRRPAGKSTGSVVATKAELDAWVMASPFREVFHLTRKDLKGDARMADSIRDRLAEMLKLREQMTTLRHEVQASLRTLKAGLETLRSELSVRGDRQRLALSVLEPQHRDSYALQVMEADMRRRAS